MATVTKAFAKSAADRRPSLVADFADLINSLTRSLYDPYRPELYYMRGPGPKWHAKHNPASASAAMLVPALARVRAR